MHETSTQPQDKKSKQKRGHPDERILVVPKPENRRVNPAGTRNTGYACNTAVVDTGVRCFWGFVACDEGILVRGVAECVPSPAAVPP